MDIKLIKYVNIFECIFCLHRTMSNTTCPLRVLKYLHACLELVMTMANVVACYSNLFKNDRIVTMEIFLNCSHSFVLLILAVYKSKKYEQMLEYFNINHLHLKADPHYNKNLQNILILASALSLATFLIQIGVLTNYPLAITLVDFYLDFILYMNLLVSGFRFLFEFYVLFSILNLMSEQLASIIRSVEEFEGVKKGTKLDIVCKGKLKAFDTWCATYTNVKESSKLFNNVYGLQVRANLIIFITFKFLHYNKYFYLHR